MCGSCAIGAIGVTEGSTVATARWNRIVNRVPVDPAAAEVSAATGTGVCCFSACLKSTAPTYGGLKFRNVGQRVTSRVTSAAPARTWTVSSRPRTHYLPRCALYLPPPYRMQIYGSLEIQSRRCTATRSESSTRRNNVPSYLHDSILLKKCANQEHLAQIRDV